VEFEIENAYVELNGYIVKQIRGLPMGGIVSAPLASMDAMCKEWENKKIWKNRGYACESMRFRDDILVLVGANLNKQGVDNIGVDYQKVYGKSLKIVVESTNKGKGTFLEYGIKLINGKLETVENNKSYEKYLKDGKFKKRFPDMEANWPDYVYIGTMYSQLVGLLGRGTKDEFMFIDGLKLLKEWEMKGYSKKVIKNAVYKASGRFTDMWVKYLDR
jgi:hypothetical protein